MMQTHIFSLHTPDLKIESWALGQSVTLNDSDLMHRMIKVLRFDVGDQSVFFNASMHAQVKIQEISKKNIVVQILSVQNHKPIEPKITFFLPLLKKEALEQAVYSLCEFGVTTIQLITVQKSRQSLLHEKEFARLQNIVIAAAEQSKNYSYSEILAPKKLTAVLGSKLNSFNIVFDPAGASFFSVYSKIVASPIGLLIGPEGGLTDQELKELEKHKFISCALTPTILTAVQAVALAAGIFRLKL